MKRLSVENLHGLAKIRGGKCLSKTYVRSQTKYKWQCDRCKFIWLATHNNVLRGKWCPQCGGNKRRTISEVQNAAVKLGGKCLSLNIRNVHEKLLFQCSMCKHKWRASAKIIFKGHWCPQCASNRPERLNDLLLVAKKRGGKCLSKKYTSSKDHYKWQCKEGHRWAAVATKVKAGQWCPYCSRHRINAIPELIEIAEDRGGKLVSKKYEGSATKLNWRCEFGHKWSATPNKIRHGQWCPVCAGRKITIEDMHEIATARGGRCLSSEYKRQDSKIKWECALGHSWEAVPNSIKNGRWCPRCQEGVSERICRGYLETIFQREFPKVRPAWLRNSRGFLMELDGYCESIGVAFEHHGEQHYTTVAPFVQNKSKLKRRIEDDKLKETLVALNNIKLIVIPSLGYRVPHKQLGDFIQKKLKDLKIEYPKPYPRKFDLSKYYTPDSRERLDKMKLYARQRGGRLLSETYVGADKNHSWVCRKGHYWEAPPSRVLAGSWCRVCAGQVPLGLKMMNDIAIGHGGRCLSRVYKNNSTYLTWQCKEGHEWEAIPNAVKRGTWCPYCSGRMNVNLKRVIQFAKTKGGKCLSSKYVNAHSKLKWKCKKGHVWEAVWSSIHSGSWCPDCNGRTRYSIGDMRALARRSNGRCVSKKYAGQQTHLLWECKKGHRWWNTPGHVMRGQWCPSCVGNMVKYPEIRPPNAKSKCTLEG